MKKIQLLVIFLCLSIGNLMANTYYVSNTGNDTNDGSINTPFRTIAHLLSIIQPGDNAYIRSGTYNLNQSTSTSGTQNAPIHISAYPGEHPVLVGSGNISNGDMFRLRHNWYILKNLEFKDGTAGLRITSNASHDSIINCQSHNHYYNGYYLAGGASYIHFVNCDAYDMYDSGSNGGNADGFGINGQNVPPGPGNTFTGCRSYHNSDDGFDVWKAAYPVEFDHCYAFDNGHQDGDGNGFKLGINETQNDKHILKNCMAWNNKQNGFDYNDNSLPQSLYNCTAYNNFRNYKFSNINGGPTTDDIQNCISAIPQNPDILLQSIIDQNTNSWNLVSPNDPNIVTDNFISTDDTVISGARNSDGNIPDSDFLKLKSTSTFIDAGIDVGIAYNGTAPDLGAFESAPMSINAQNSSYTLRIYPNPASNYLMIQSTNNSDKTIKISSLSGQILLHKKSLKKSIKINTTNLPTGVYIISIQNKGVIENKRILIQNN